MLFERNIWYECQTVVAKKRPRNIEAASMDGSYLNRVRESIGNSKRNVRNRMLDQVQKCIKFVDSVFK